MKTIVQRIDYRAFSFQ